MTDVAEERDDRALIDALTEVAPVLHFARWGVDVEHWAYRLLHDPTFALEMRLCKEWGIPHSQFLEWDETDRAKAIAHHLHEGQRCGQCGIHPAEWDPEEYPPPFESELRTCPGCEELAKRRRHLQEQGKSSPSLMDGVTPYLRRRQD